MVLKCYREIIYFEASALGRCFFRALIRKAPPSELAFLKVRAANTTPGRLAVSRLWCLKKYRRGEGMLTPKQELFAQKIVEGMSYADAYRSAYSCKKMSDKTIWENASRLMADSKVLARVQELRDKISLESVMTAQERLEWLTTVIRGEDFVVSDKLRAVDIMNKMQGEYVTKVDGNISVAKLEDLI